MMILTATGRLTRDAELKYTASGTELLSFSVASDVGFGNDKHPVYLGCTVWGKRAESLSAYLLKGTPVTVVGNADLRLWEKGEKHGAEITVNVTEITMHGTAGGNSGQQAEKPAATGFRKAPAPLGATTASDFVDDDIPF